MGRNGNLLKTKIIACAMSAVLAVGLTPLLAFASETASAAPAAQEVQALTVGAPEQGATGVMTLDAQYKVFSYSWEEVQDHIYRAEDNVIIELSVDVKDDDNKGRILVDGVTATIDLRGHEMNRKRNSADVDGHVIEVVNGGNLTIRDSAGGGRITGGYAKNGGAINIDATSTCTIEGGTITGNKASIDGGAICVKGTLTMTGGTITGNTADDTGGGIYVTDTGTFSLSNATITGNTANNRGGGINMHLKSDATITNCQITSNECKKDIGGGILLNAPGRKLTITNTAIDNNISKDDGAGIYLDNGAIVMTGGSLSNNVTNNDGGGAKITPGTSFTADGVEISGNDAKTEEGGGIKNQGTTVLNGCTISGNHAKKQGGGIFNDNDDNSEGDLTIEDCTIELNKSDANGGGVYSDKKLTIKGGSQTDAAKKTQITKNYAADGRGCGVFIGGDSDPTDIEGIIVVDGNDQSYGGKDVFLRSDQKLNLSGPLIAGTKIGITMQDGFGTFTTGYKANNGNADPSTFFSSPEEFKPVLASSGNDAGEACFEGKPWKRDYEFSFSNSSSSFNTGKYTMLDNDYKKMCAYIDEQDWDEYYKDIIAKRRGKEWSGACFGMSMSTLLDYTGQIDFNKNFDSADHTMYQAPSPSKNKKILSAIHYYHLSQYIDEVRVSEQVFNMNWDNWQWGLQQLVFKASKREPMRFGYFYTDKGESYGHSIVVKGYKGLDSEGNYELLAWDNRRPSKDTILTVSKDFSSLVVNADDKERPYKVKYTSDFTPYDKIDIDGPNNDMVINGSANLNTQSVSGTKIYVPSNMDAIIKNNEGETLRVSDGTIVESTMEVLDENFIVNSTEEGNPAPGELVVTVANSDNYTITSESGNIEASIVSDRFFSEVEAQNADAVTMSEQGTSLFGDKVNYSVTQSVISDFCDMLSFNGTTNGDAIFSFAADKILISGHDGGDISIDEFFDGNPEAFLISSALSNLSIPMEFFKDPVAYGHKMEGVILKEANHSWSKWVTVIEPTATTPGQKIRFCAINPTHVETQVIPALGQTGIAKAANPLKVKVSKKTYKRTVLTKAKSFRIGATGGKGKVTYTLSKAAKSANIKVSPKGKVTVPKKCKKGTYKITVKAAGTKNYKIGKKTVAITVK